MKPTARSADDHLLTLVLGGISSGKSNFALRLAQEQGGRVLVIATGRASDPEMEARIAAHRRQRPAGWSLVEEALRLERAARAHPDIEVALIDSIDAWVANRMEAARVEGPGEQLDKLEKTCLRAIEEVVALVPRVICVSSEVGLGTVPLHPLGRAFADLLGRLNQSLAARAGERYLVVAGAALPLPAPPPPVAHPRRSDQRGRARRRRTELQDRDRGGNHVHGEEFD
jgi:adenosylcobinamide kinase/adenosylcobinamide-phosphate guanylyltransferase